MLTDAQATAFERDGFVLGERVLSDAETAELQAETLRVIDRRDAGGIQPDVVRNLSRDESAPVWQIVNIWQASEPFRRLVSNPLIAGAIARLARARQVRLWHDQIQYKPAEKGGVNMWHQDHPYWGVIAPATQVTAWIALDDAGEDNGCMSMVPGSHKLGNKIDFLHTIKSFDAMPAECGGVPLTVKTCPVPRGHVHFHHALTFHGSSANTSGRPRRAIALHFMTEETRYVAAGDHLLKPFITVADGEPLAGAKFPLVWDGHAIPVSGRPLTSAPTA